MKQQTSGTVTCPRGGPGAAASLQEGLVAAIHGAFEVAVEIVVREVKSLLATSGSFSELRRENELLKERLQRAEAALVSRERDGGSPPERPREEPDSGSEAQQSVGQDAAEQSGVKVESLKASCQRARPQDGLSSPHPGASTPERVTVKQEREDSPSCLDAIKMEDYGLDCMSEVRSRMLEEQRLLVEDEESQDLNLQLTTAGPVQADSPNPTSGILPVTDLLSLSSEFPNLFQVADPAPPEAPPQVYGVRVRTSCTLSSAAYACKSCGQSFHLPSLLRRHGGQCQQRLQPAAGEAGARTRLQLYPPGCSPFHCTVCNREFNRLENLKTHLRIHTGERPYTCSVCSKCFRHSGALKRHIRIHTGEKPYVCGQCGKSFRNWGGLKFHQGSHAKQPQL